jgi:hypothetical protein
MGKKTHAIFLETIEMEQQEPFLRDQQETQTQTQRNSFLYTYASYDRIGFTLLFFNICIPLVFIIIVLWFIIEHSS